MENINELFAQLAEYNNLQEETKSIIENLQEQIKTYMTETNQDTVIKEERK